MQLMHVLPFSRGKSNKRGAFSPESRDWRGAALRLTNGKSHLNRISVICKITTLFDLSSCLHSFHLSTSLQEILREDLSPWTFRIVS